MRKGWGIALAAVALAGCDHMLASGIEHGGALYTMDNAAGGNHVLVFARDEEGRLAYVDAVSTGGLGSGPDPTFGTDPLGAQDAVVLSDDGRFLFVVNAGSDDVSSFRVNPDGSLALAARVPSGGVEPVSLATSEDDFLYVVNAGGGGGISGFRVGEDGGLLPLERSTLPLGGGSAAPGPGSIRASPDGGTLIVTERRTDRLVFYSVNFDGIPRRPVPVLAPGPTPCGAEFDELGHYILAQGNVGTARVAAPDGGSLSSLALTSYTSADTISGSMETTETAGCRVRLAANGRYAYTANTGSGTLTGFRVSADGSLTRLVNDGKTAVIGPQAQPLDMASADGYLYVLTPGDGGVHAYHVERDGSLVPRPDAGVAGILPISVTGLAAY